MPGEVEVRGRWGGMKRMGRDSGIRVGSGVGDNCILFYEET